MKIAFHINCLGLRGVEVSTYDFAHYNEEILRNQSLIIAGKHSYFDHHLARKKFQDRFDQVFIYDDFASVKSFVKSQNVDMIYYQKGGDWDNKIVSGVKNVVHSVFQFYEPHGDVYAYVSEWLSIKMTGGNSPFVPLMVQLPEIEGNLRAELDIPRNSLVFGRHGGLETFDLGFVQKAIIDHASQRPDTYFVFVNTNRFGPALKNVIFLDGFADMTRKALFINTCDAMIHARHMGESFGLAIGEFSIRNKPVITWRGGKDQAHLHMLGDAGIYYDNGTELKYILDNFSIDSNTNYDRYSAHFNPVSVMNKFREVFI